MPLCLICIGSNDHRAENLSLAQQRLRLLFPNIRFAAEQETEPIDLPHSALFTNQVALFETALSPTDLRHLFKEIEHRAGRRPEDKQVARVCLDIDLLTYGDEVLRPHDLERSYVIKGINKLIG